MKKRRVEQRAPLSSEAGSGTTPPILGGNALVTPSRRPLAARLHPAWFCLGLGTMVVFGFWGVWGHGFMLLDDEHYVTGNALVRSGLSWANLLGAFRDTHLANWHPLTLLSHMLDCQCFGLHAGAHHGVNLAWHLANTLGLFLLLRQLTGATWRSAFVAAGFGVHPLHVESVAWISERKDVLSTFFFLLTLGAYCRYARERQSAPEAGPPAQPAPSAPLSLPAKHAYALTLGCFALGLMCKPMLVTTPLVLLLLDYWPLNRLTSSAAGTRLRTFWVLVREKWPCFALAAADAVITLWAQRNAGAMEAVPVFPLGLRVENAVVACGQYLWKLLWPANLAVFYPLPPHWSAAQVGGSLLAVLTISGLVFLARERRPYLLFGWLWYLVTLTPVLGLVQVGAQAAADRYTYIPAVGVVVALGWAVAGLASSRKARRTLAVAGLLVAVLWLVGTRRQVSFWRSDETLFRHALEVTTDNALAHYCLGHTLVQQQRFEAAVGQLRAALRLRPDYPAAQIALEVALAGQGQLAEALPRLEAAVQAAPQDSRAHFNLANRLSAAGQVDAAIAHYQESVRLQPEFAPAWKNLGDAWQRKNQPDQALPAYRQALRQEPGNAECHNNLGNVLAALGQTEEALAQYQAALQLKPDYASAENNWGNTLVAQGALQEAVAHFEGALRLSPSFVKAENSLGCTLTMLGRPAEATPHFLRALQIRPDYAEARYNLANTLVEQGQSAEAQRQFELALEAQPDFAEAHRQLALLLRAQHQLRAAATHLQAALRRQPTDQTSLLSLAWLYATAPAPDLRHGQEAVVLAERACVLNPKPDALTLDTLAAAYAEVGQFAQATQVAQQGIAVATAAGQTNTAATLRHRLEGYRAGQPWREASQ